MSQYERDAQHRLVSFGGSVNSNEINIIPGATYSLYLDADFAGTEITIRAYVEGVGFKDVTDPSAELPVAVVADTVNIMPTAIYSSAAEFVKFVSDASETCTGVLLIRE